MKKTMIGVIIALALVPFAVNASGLPKGFHDIESAPRLKISHNSSGFLVYEVESVKYHLCTLYIDSDVPSETYLIKEKYKTEITDGAEGARSKIVLELWKLGTRSVEKRIWRLSREADKWQFANQDEIVFVKYGCCDSPNEYYYYDIKTGSFLRSSKSMDLPANRQEH